MKELLCLILSVLLRRRKKHLLIKMMEFYAKFESNPSADLFDANLDVILKTDQVFLQYGMYTLREIMLCQFGNPDSEIDQWYFNLHFYNFFMDLIECWRNVHKWSGEDNAFFLKDLNEGGMKNKVYRIPRGSSANLDIEMNLTSNQEINAGFSRAKLKINRDK